MNCFDCKNRSGFPNGTCPLCHDYDRYEPRAKTNADRIRAMTDEELAGFLASVTNDASEKGLRVKGFMDTRYSQKSWIDWLKQDVSHFGDWRIKEGTNSMRYPQFDDLPAEEGK